MPVRRVVPAEHRRVRWRNGGGTTSEIVVEPAAALAGERFLYRVSIADVEVDGPFSRFDGYDRHIAVIDGAGMRLDCGRHGILALPPLVPRTFSGDWDVGGTLVAGPVRDFNLMVDRERASSSLEIRRLVEPTTLDVAAGGTTVVHVVDGALLEADRGDTLLLDASAELAPRGIATLLVGRISPRAAG